MSEMAIKKLNRKTVSLKKYAGKWVAFVNGKIVSWGNTLEELMTKVKKMGLEKKASVFLVPRKDEGPYSFSYWNRRKNFRIFA